MTSSSPRLEGRREGGPELSYSKVLLKSLVLPFLIVALACQGSADHELVARGKVLLHNGKEVGFTLPDDDSLVIGVDEKFWELRSEISASKVLFKVSQIENIGMKTQTVELKEEVLVGLGEIGSLSFGQVNVFEILDSRELHTD